ncbi:MAG: hypothetical protein QXE50_08320 [Nitrososphaerota archaeon]
MKQMKQEPSRLRRHLERFDPRCHFCFLMARGINRYISYAEKEIADAIARGAIAEAEGIVRLAERDIEHAIEEWRQAHPHCDQCGILVGEAHDEMALYDGLCWSCFENR